MKMLNYLKSKIHWVKPKRQLTNEELDIKCECIYAMVGENSMAIVYLLNKIKELECEIKLLKNDS